MKHTLIAAAALVLMGAAGSAMADGRGYIDESLSRTLGEDVLTGLLDDYKDGSYTNLSVNTGDIDASVTIEGGEDVAIGGREIKVEGELDFDLDQDSGVATTVTTLIDLSGIAGSSIKTVAVGAMNEGTVNVSGISFTASKTLERSESEMALDIEAELKASEGSRDRRSEAQSLSGELEASFASETESMSLVSEMTRNALPEVSVMNLAYNTGDVSAAVSIAAGHRDDVELSNLAISTTAIGAINTAVINIGAVAAK